MRPPPRLPRALPAPAQGPPPLRLVGHRHRPDVRPRPLHGHGARPPGPQPDPPRPRRRQPRGDLRRHQGAPPRQDQDRRARPLPRRHPSRRRGDPAAPGGDGGAGRGAAGEQRRDKHAGRGVPTRGGHRAVCADDTGEPVGADGGHGGGAAGDAGAGEGRHRQRRLGVHGGRPVLPSLHRLQLHEKVRRKVLQMPLRRVQEQRNRRPISGPVLRAHAHAVERGEGEAPAVVRGDGGRVHPHGGTVDRQRPALRARRRPEAPAVPHRIRAGLGPRLVPDPPAPAAPSRRPGSSSDRRNRQRQFTGRRDGRNPQRQFGRAKDMIRG